LPDHCNARKLASSNQGGAIKGEPCHDTSTRFAALQRLQPCSPWPAAAESVYLVEGEGGENQMVNDKSSRETFWNFLHVQLK
jgi:hypothetical protein